MKRTHEWWARLTPGERSELWYLERAGNRDAANDAGVPEGYGGCNLCDSPTQGALCRTCLRRSIELVCKAEGITSQKG